MPTTRRRALAIHVITWVLAAGTSAAMGSCAGNRGPRSPHGASSVEGAVLDHALVETVNEYDRATSAVLIRRVERPTRATLDYAAYHRNRMIADLPPDPIPPVEGATLGDEPFGGVVDPDTLVGSIGETDLTPDEQRYPLAFPPMVDYLAREDAELAAGLERFRSEVRQESWGLKGAPHLVRQRVTEAFLTTDDELWVRIELEPWFEPRRDLTDADGDGYSELYARVDASLIPPAATDLLRSEYIGRVLGADEVKLWANELASYWYPSYNTDIFSMNAAWPVAKTEPEAKAEVEGVDLDAPTIVIRGVPDRKPLYSVILVEGIGDTEQGGQSRFAQKERSAEDVQAEPEAVAAAIEAELRRHGGSWGAWVAQQKEFQRAAKKVAASRPEKVKTLIGEDGFLFFRKTLDYVRAGDLSKQRPGKNPIPAIVEFKQLLAGHGVDFLFVPVPTKVEVYPDKLAPGLETFEGEIVHPNGRRILLDLAKEGVEVVDLLPHFIDARKQADGDEQRLYQRQDTHWTDRGLKLAAEVIAKRIRQYPWYAEELKPELVEFGTRKKAFTHDGDLVSRLADADQKRFEPVELLGTQVLLPSGALYEDVMESPVTLIGDSFTGVYQRTLAEHAGVSAHVAKEIGYPADLVMSWGGGPDVRMKLLRRGAESLGGERVVVWIMTARDLYDYKQDWKLLDDE